MENTLLDGNNVSFLAVRTNPRLTTNVKLVTNGDSMWLESYPVSPVLSRSKYRAYSVSGNNAFNIDVAKFYSGISKDDAFVVGQKFSTDSMTNQFENQYENIYWAGAESIESPSYDETIGVIAPLYIDKIIPRYFVVFKVDKPSDFDIDSQTPEEYSFDFDKMRGNMSILCTFDLTDKTAIGKYLQKYVNQPNFNYDPMYVNFSTKEITYYGFDFNYGTMTHKTENFDSALLKNDLTVLSMDDWLTSGWYRNNMVFPNMINLEFIFDDPYTKEYEFSRYFGLYCNDIQTDILRLKENDFVQCGTQQLPINRVSSKTLNTSSVDTIIEAGDNEKIQLILENNNG